MTQSPSPSTSFDTNEELIDALKKVVEGENAAVWGFSYLLSFIPDNNKNYATSIFNLHRNQRDLFRLKLRDLNEIPPRPKEGYSLPFEVSDIVTAYKLAIFIENRLIGIYLKLFSLTSKNERSQILDYALQGSLRMLEFKDSPRALPGSLD